MNRSEDAVPGGAVDRVGQSNPSPLRIAVFGAAGRMGSLVAEACRVSPGFVLGPRIARPGSESQGFVAAADVSADEFDLLIEFSVASSFSDVAKWAKSWGRPWVSGTTGLRNGDQKTLATVAEKIPILWSPNMSLGVALLARALHEAARILPSSWQMEMVETHHPAKLDAPSGTALALAEVWQEERGGEIVYGREGRTGPRPESEIGVHALRLPNVVGEHRVFLGGPDETLEWTHRAEDRHAFVAGALEGAKWLATKKAGLYCLDDWARDRLENR